MHWTLCLFLGRRNKGKKMNTETIDYRNKIRKGHLSRQRHQLNVLVFLFFITVVSSVLASGAVAQATKQVNMKTSISISDIGDANVNVDIHMPMRAYTIVKQQYGNAQYMARTLSSSVAWSEIKNLQGEFQDAKNIVNAKMTHVGYAKPYKHGKWVIDLSGEDLTFVVLAGNIAHFSASLDLPFGATHVLCQVVLPKESKNQRFDKESKKLYYDFIPKYEEGEETDFSFELETKPKVMSSLAQIYGNEKFDNFWVARSRFTNTGNTVIKNMRVRYRVANLSSWSGWKKTQIVYPGQTIIEPFFPVLDVEKIAKFNSTRNAMVEVEYRFQADGEKVEDSDSKKTQILARNEVEWSSYDAAEGMGFFEYFNNSPSIYGAFCTTNDPVVQQVAGSVARMINGRSPDNDKDALLYLEGIWAFLKMNGIAYQLPPSGIVDGKSLQHLKYARDVLRNKSGTCADLAIIWASIARAGGLTPCVMVVPGHAFPAFIMPKSGRVIPVESTLISGGSFKQALEEGAKKMAYYSKQGTIIVVNINQMHSKGVHCLDLPPVGTDFLKNLGYKMEIPKRNTSQHNQVQPNVGKVNVNVQPAVVRPKALCGIWRAELITPNGTMKAVFHLHENGSAASISKMFDNYGNLSSSESDKGTWSVQGNRIRSYSSVTNETIFVPFQLKQGVLYITLEGIRLTCNKVKQ